MTYRRRMDEESGVLLVWRVKNKTRASLPRLSVSHLQVCVSEPKWVLQTPQSASGRSNQSSVLLPFILPRGHAAELCRSRAEWNPHASAHAHATPSLNKLISVISVPHWRTSLLTKCWNYSSCLSTPDRVIKLIKLHFARGIVNSKTCSHHAKNLNLPGWGVFEMRSTADKIAQTMVVTVWKNRTVMLCLQSTNLVESQVWWWIIKLEPEQLILEIHINLITFCIIFNKHIHKNHISLP